MFCRDTQLHASTPPAIRVYTLTGTLVIISPLQQGETVIPLPRGLYIVKAGDTVRKVTAW
ncbi:MAG: T9SS type A sorting domain-containing protein [Tannerella sp.]|jgi:hypothetical protein|nr:T9SS type A sorting domain-containing protein [Tannerella sp.]